jgi:spore germination protein YaaH
LTLAAGDPTLADVPSPRSLCLVVLAVVLAVGCEAAPSTAPGSASAAAEVPSVAASRAPTIPGHELYGYLPYWEMDDGIDAHLRDVPLTTLALFSVTHTSRGAINTTQAGYRAITGDLGRQLIQEAHDRGTRVEVVYTSFGSRRNTRLFEDAERQDAVIESLVDLLDETEADGINVDVEVLDPTLIPAYGLFVERLRAAAVAQDEKATVSVATGAGPTGAAMAKVAAEAGADRIFLMGYDYRVASSSPGASAPLDRSDGGLRSLRWSLDLYETLGVPADRLLLGLPLYGLTWPVAGPVIGAPETGRGDHWIPSQHRDILRDDAIDPMRDEVEQVDVYVQASDGSWGAPTPGASMDPNDLDRTWTAIYVDSPATLASKLTLANDRGLAGGGFWAIGYERGLAGYRELMDSFTAGEALP